MKEKVIKHTFNFTRFCMSQIIWIRNSMAGKIISFFLRHPVVIFYLTKCFFLMRKQPMGGTEDAIHDWHLTSKLPKTFKMKSWNSVIQNEKCTIWILELFDFDRVGWCWDVIILNYTLWMIVFYFCVSLFWNVNHSLLITLFHICYYDNDIPGGTFF